MFTKLKRWPTPKKYRKMSYVPHIQCIFPFLKDSEKKTTSDDTRKANIESAGPDKVPCGVESPAPKCDTTESMEVDWAWPSIEKPNAQTPHSNSVLVVVFCSIQFFCLFLLQTFLLDSLQLFNCITLYQYRPTWTTFSLSRSLTNLDWLSYILIRLIADANMHNSA